MTPKIYRTIWLTLFILALVVLVMKFSDLLKPITMTRGDSPFITALNQLGILYIIALVVERSLEVFIKAWRQGDKLLLEKKVQSTNGGSAVEAESALEIYKAGTQKRALLLGLIFGILISLSGVRILGAIFEFTDAKGWLFQHALFQLTDILLTAGLIAGGSKTIHELMGLIDNFLRQSRQHTTTPKAAAQ